MNDRIFVTRSVLPPLEEYMAEISGLWESRWITNMGNKHELLEKELGKYLKAKRISLMCSGHMALELCLQGMGLTGEVITTPFTFASTVHAIVRSGLTPVFCDIDPDNYTLDPDRIEELITGRTSAILPVHVYGNVCAVEKIKEIADRRRLRVVYDAAHAFGVEINGRGIAAFGDAAAFSFHATKVFHTIEGGAVCFSDEKLGETLYHLKNFGIMGPEEVDGVGANAKMNEFQAAMGICNLRHIEEHIEKRRTLWELYRALLDGIPGLKLPEISPGVKYNYAYFPVVIDKEAYGAGRDETADRLAKRGIMVRKYFYPLVSSYACYRGRLNPGDTPNARRISDGVITLPLYPELAEEDVERICGYMRQIYRRKGGE